MTATAKKIKTTAAVFELPQKLGILQYVEYEPSSEGVVYQRRVLVRGASNRRGVPQRHMRKVPRVGLLEGTKGGGRRRSDGGGVAMKRRAVASSSRWLTPLWELSDRFDVGVWYERM
jgi:hypothetical protein